MTSLDRRGTAGGHFKDEILGALAEHHNVAQFVSFSPGSAEIRFMQVAGESRELPASVEEALEILFAAAIERSVNVRAFDPLQPKSHEFLYGLTTVSGAAAHVRRLASVGLFTIANETVDITDGGVSGVLYGGVVEFAPDDTPRCVEKPGTASLPRTIGLAILETVYGFPPELAEAADSTRVEFSLHPGRRGVRNGHTLIWEEERTEPVALQPAFVWPNNFSRLVGDKTFGLLVADSVGLRVPRTTVVARRVAPFWFGRPTGTGETWLRTAPAEPVPGLYTTLQGWRDPFQLLDEEDADGSVIASVLSQESVEPWFSGAASSRNRGMTATVEGVRGPGDRFMLGEAPPEPLPANVSAAVREALHVAARHFGDARLEWVHDGDELWIVQMHRGGTISIGNVVYPGTATVEHEFLVSSGIAELRDLADRLAGTGEGVVLVGQVGVTSHFGDVLRRARVPSRIEARDAVPAVQQLPLSARGDLRTT